jgi:hypothetical protein
MIDPPQLLPCVGEGGAGETPPHPDPLPRGERGNR